MVQMYVCVCARARGYEMPALYSVKAIRMSLMMADEEEELNL